MLVSGSLVLFRVSFPATNLPEHLQSSKYTASSQHERSFSSIPQEGGTLLGLASVLHYQKPVRRSRDRYERKHCRETWLSVNPYHMSAGTHKAGFKKCARIKIYQVPAGAFQCQAFRSAPSCLPSLPVKTCVSARGQSRITLASFVCQRTFV